MMKLNIANSLGCSIEQVSIKAMSYNEVGPIGKGDAVKSTCVVLISNE